jgi:hypothetical protein
MNWCLHGVYAGQVDSILVLFSGEASFHFAEYVNSKSNRYWYAENHILVHRLSLLDVMVGVWCAMSTMKIVFVDFLQK